MAAFTAIKQSTDSGQMAYDQMLAEGNESGNALVQAAVDALVAQTREIEKAVAALGLDQVAVLPFYETLGYVAEGKVFIEAAIKHRWMKKRLGAHA